MAELSERIKLSIGAQEQYLNLHAGILARAGISLAGALARGNKLIAVGCPLVAEHMVAEIVGKYVADRPGLPAIALSENAASLTAITNDFGRDRVYLRLVDALSQPGDFVLGLMAGVDHPAQTAIDHAQRLGLETLVLEIPGAEEWVATETFLTAAHLLCEEMEMELQRLKPQWFPPDIQ
jgi:D-sedoheptulose 7-phosphate isomerase